MEGRDFCYWLQGYLELREQGSERLAGLTEGQVEMIKKHLSLVFIHEIDPLAGDADHQKKLNEAHGNQTSPFKDRHPGARC